ncbi:MAG: MFS transporter [Acidobacteriota bacterium]|nr:MFS transporter [Acidobacteriota bacterium]
MRSSLASSITAKSSESRARAWAVWLIAATFYLAAFYVRVSPAVMTGELMRDLRIGATELGYLSAFYYYAYVAMQFPTGVLVDRLGPRRLLTAGAIAAAAGTLLFSLSDSFALACLARAIMGGSTAIGWVITLKLATTWFPRRLFATLTGVSLFIGNMGALFAQVPLRVMVEAFGWRAVGMGTAAFIAAVCFLAWAVVRDSPPGGLAAPVRAVKKQGSFRGIAPYRNTWLIFVAQGGFVGGILSFTGLWGPTYLRTHYGIEQTAAAAVCSVMIVCWACASPLFGHLSDRMGKRKPLYAWGALVTACGWTALFYVPGLPLAGFIAIAALTSLATGAVILGFAYSKESVPDQYMGTISGVINAGNMLGPMVLQPAIGALLDRTHDFRIAFVPLIGWIALSALLASQTRETYCRPSAGQAAIG